MSTLSRGRKHELAWMIAFLPISAGTEFHVPVSETNVREQLLILVKGIMMLDSQVQNLVNAMAAFAPPAAGQSTLPAAYATALTPVLAANWQ